MKKIFIILLISLIPVQVFSAPLYVDTPPAESGSGWNEVNGTTYTGTPGVGTGYSTIQAAVNAMNGSDNIYVRGGTYTEVVTIPFTTTDGTAENYSSMESYPGEWAVIDGTGTTIDNRYLIGNLTYDADGSNSTKYWRFERLEITNYPTHGFMFSVGPFIFRYLYVHGGSSVGSQGDNPAGIYVNLMEDSIIKYCLFDDNGGPIIGDVHNNDIMPVGDYWWTQPGFDRDTNYWNPDFHVQNNEIAYNYFPNTTGRSHASYRVKAQQFLDAKTTVDFNTKGDLGDKFHHNISLNTIIGEQDFLQIYNNILTDDISATLTGPGYTTGMTGVCVYNNTILDGGRIAASFGLAPSTGVPTPYMYWYANIIDEGVSSSIYDQLSMHGRSTNTILESRIVMDFNYVYRSSDQDDYLYMDYTESTVDRIRQFTTAEYNTTYSRTNYVKATSEGTDNLMVGVTGADQYTTRGAHSNGTNTIATGGANATHPYLPGINLPAYGGATNPNDNDWVAGVLLLGVPYFTTVVSGTTPSWIEGAATSPVVTCQSDDTTTNTSYPFTATYTLEGARTVASCTWSNSLGGTGSCTATGGNITGTATGLSVGDNVITIELTDSEAETGNCNFTVTRTQTAVDMTVSGCDLSGADM